MPDRRSDEEHGARQPLLASHQNGHTTRKEVEVKFDDGDDKDPRNWPASRKWLQTLQIFLLAFVCPAASSIISPALSQIQSSFDTTKTIALLGQAGFVCMLGIGPLFHAPMSETFGRRKIFLINLALFTVLQIPTALVQNAWGWVVLRTVSGFFGSVGVANGGGAISDMFETHERSQVLGVYLVAPLLGPTVGPFLGGLITGSLSWRWIFWIVLILSGLTTVICYFFFFETRAVTILEHRKMRLEKEDPDARYYVKGVSDQSLGAKVLSNSTCAIRILTTQPIVMTMSLYQALIFSGMYSLYAEYTSIFGTPPYNFSVSQVGLAYLAPAVGFIITAGFIVAYIDRLYDWLSEKNGDDGRPEYRLPMANIGAIFLPISLFWFGWAAEKKLAWPITLAATLLFGASQVSIFNTVQTYYIDSFESNAASALAAGAFLRSVVGGIVPLFVGSLFDKLGYGLGMSVFGILSVILMPAPMLFYWYGRRLREKFPFNS